MFEWEDCGLCSSNRFLKTPSGYWLCMACFGDGAILVKFGHSQPVPERLIIDIENGIIK